MAVAISQTRYCNNEELDCPVINGVRRCLDPTSLSLLKVCLMPIRISAPCAAVGP